MKKYKETRYVILLAVIMASIIIFLFWHHYDSLKKSNNFEKIRTHTAEVISLSNDFILYLFDVEVSESHYILSKNPVFYQRFLKDKERAIEHLGKLKETSTFSFPEKHKFDSLNTFCQEKFADWDREIVLFHSGKTEELISLKAASEIKMDRIEVLLGSLVNLQNKFRREARAVEDNETVLSLNFLAVGALVIGLIVLLLFISLFIEISKRKKIETELFISNEWFSKTLESMGDGVISTDNIGNIIFLNKVAESITGWNTIEAKGKSIDEIFPITNIKTNLPVENPVKKALKENRIVFLQEHSFLTRRDGTAVNIDDSAAPVINDDEEIIGGVLIFRDISEQEIIRKKLIENEKILKDIIDNTASLIAIKDINSNFLLVNFQYEKAFNCTASDLIGKNSQGIYSTELSKKFALEDEIVIREQRRSQFEDTIVHSDGSIHYYYTVKFPLFDSENVVYGVCSVSTDITESKLNIEIKEKLAGKEILRKSEFKYSELTENMPSRFFSLNHNMEIIHWNKACEDFNDIKAEDAMGKSITDVLNYVQNDSLLFNQCREALSTSSTRDLLHYINYKNHNYVFLVIIYPTQLGISVLMSDVTEEKRSEEETILLVERLQKMNKELRQFTYIVSHNLRAPIAKIQGLASLFSPDPSENETNQVLMSTLNTEAVNLDNVVRDLNTIISSTEFESAEKQNVFFKNKVALIRQVLSTEIVNSKAEIQMDFEKAEYVKSIKSYIYSIVFNLISNAIKYRSQNRDCIIHLKTEIVNEFVCLSVKDNGIGINMEKNGNKIFSLYRRFHNDSAINGKGMGLYLVKSQAESLGGRVEVESEINKGTTFRVFFPNNE